LGVPCGARPLWRGGAGRFTAYCLQTTKVKARYATAIRASRSSKRRAKLPLLVNPIQNIPIYGNNVYGRRHLRDALDILRRTRQKYPYDRIVSHQFPLEEVNEVLAAQDKGHITRASLVP
jgi:Zn-dependent alcohol dehydrogenase